MSRFWVEFGGWGWIDCVFFFVGEGGVLVIDGYGYGYGYGYGGGCGRLRVDWMIDWSID